jgi:signal peptidase II
MYGLMTTSNTLSQLTLSQRMARIGIATFSCVVLDQVSKAIAKSLLNLFDAHLFLGGTVRFQLAHNTGAFLGLGDSLPDSTRQMLFTIGVGALLFGVLVYAMISKAVDRIGVTALALIFAGGTSNLGDRIVYGGYVVDFVQMGIGPLRTGVFNIADMAIMAGAFLLLFEAFRKSSSDSKQQ